MTSDDFEFAVLANMVDYPDKAFTGIRDIGIDESYFHNPVYVSAFTELMQISEEPDRDTRRKKLSSVLRDKFNPDEFRDRFASFVANPAKVNYYLCGLAEQAIRYNCKKSISEVFNNASLQSDMIPEYVASITSEMNARLDAIKAFRKLPVESDKNEIDGTKPIPEELLNAPGFIDEYIKFTMHTAQRPNRVLAFSGALAMLSILTARKYQSVRKATPNLYIVALAESGVGKGHARHINKSIASACNMCDALADRIGSGEGLEDALRRTPAMLFQIDEFDTLLNAMKSPSNISEGIYTYILNLFSEAREVHHIRKKAMSGERTTAPDKIYAPSVTIYATATPQHFYDSLSKRALDNGFIARLLIFEVGKRGKIGDLTASETLPSEILEPARVFTNRLCPIDQMPNPYVVPDDVGADGRAKAISDEADALYDKSCEQHDGAGLAIWNRGFEMTDKLALLYALSENPAMPKITAKGLDWAWKIVRYCFERMLAMSKEYVSADQYDADANAVLRKIRSYGAKGVMHSEISRVLGYTSKRMESAIKTLIDRESIIVTSGNRNAKIYRIK